MSSTLPHGALTELAHALRTPLTSIRGYVELMLEDRDQLPAAAVAHLETVHRNALLLQDLVDELLAPGQWG